MKPAAPATLWTPSPERIAHSRLTAYRVWLAKSRSAGPFADYDALWQWSTTELGAFWSSLAEFFGVHWHAAAERALGCRAMPGAEWFPGGALNWAEHCLRGEAEATAIIYRSESGERLEWSYGELRDEVARVQSGLLRLGVVRGDRVAGYLASTPQAVAAVLACASLGAIWSSCPPEFGASAVLDRFRQIEPRVLLAHDGYPYNGRFFDRSAAVAKIRAGLPGLEATVVLRRSGEPAPGALTWEEFTAPDESRPATLEFAPLPFSHPLWILYSSGTTGLPKGVVHSHGGILLEHLKQLALQNDLGAGDRFFWYSTTGWMMWNYLVSGLAVGSAIVLYEGSPSYPDLSALFRLAAEERLTYFGTSAPFLMACRKAGIEPGRENDLAALRSLGSTGAPLPEEGFEWVYAAVHGDLCLASLSGGTDVCTAFVGPCPLRPVRRGEIQAIGLGTAAQAFDEEGQPLVGEVGELVITEPMPSMPVFLWGDPEGVRYRAAYFETYPGIWRHGDWIRFDAAGRSVIYGRSDSTLNRGGVRIGTSELYRAVDTLPEISDSLAIDTGSLESAGKLWLFVVLREGHSLDAELEARLRSTLRDSLSPRHVPDEIRAVSDLPRTLSGKKLEVPIRRLLAGVPEERALKRGTLANPESIEPLLAAARLPGA